MRGLFRFLRELGSEPGGAVSILAALVLVSVIGVSALALEYGHGLLQKVENQRVADLAAYGGALVYGATSSSTSATGAAANVAALNGMSCSRCASVVTSPTGDGNSAVKVIVTKNVPLVLARVVTTSTTMAVTATAYAEIKSDAPACVIALSGSGTGVALSGTGSISAPGCAVASNSTVCANNGANSSDVITTKVIDYGSGSSPSSSRCTLSPPSGTSSVKTNNVTTTDPLAPSSGSPGSTEVTNAASRISTVSSMTSPSAPLVSTVSGGSSVSFGSSKITGSLPSGCTGALASSVWTVTCTSTGPYTFGPISHNGGVTVNFVTSSGVTYNFSGGIPSGVGLSGAGAGTYYITGGITTTGGTSFAPGTYNISGSITISGATTFGAGTYNINGSGGGGIVASGSGVTTFGSGTFNIGTTSASPCPSAGYSICVSGSASMAFGGPSSFSLAGGIYQGASGMPPNPGLSFGYGSTITADTFNIGKASDGYSLNEANGATLFGDATGSGDLFQMAGSVTTSGGTCVAISAAAEHDIDGSLNGAGAIVLGAGIYTINGYVALGNGGGGDVSGCPTSTTTPATGLLAPPPSGSGSGAGVTLVISGAHTVTCGSTTSAFCLGAGYSHVTLTAPTSGNTANLAVVGPQSSTTTAGAAFTTGATNTQISGAFYFPKGPVTMSGAAALHDRVDSTACLELIGSQVTLSNGSAAGTTCAGLSSSSLGTTVTLVE